MSAISRRSVFGLLAGVAAAPLVGEAKPVLYDYGPGPKVIGVDYAVGEDAVAIIRHSGEALKFYRIDQPVMLSAVPYGSFGTV